MFRRMYLFDTDIKYKVAAWWEKKQDADTRWQDKYLQRWGEQGMEEEAAADAMSVPDHYQSNLNPAECVWPVPISIPPPILFSWTRQTDSHVHTQDSVFGDSLGTHVCQTILSDVLKHVLIMVQGAYNGCEPTDMASWARFISPSYHAIGHHQPF